MVRGSQVTPHRRDQVIVRLEIAPMLTPGCCSRNRGAYASLNGLRTCG
ncbi:MAG TPA: hypothetical protein VN969_46795 [Streptosporangiaceae bacterium]|nr:hypothetical protein [Streptosporangiaceae bacterium]